MLSLLLSSSCSITDYDTDSVIVIGGSLSEGSKESGQYGDIQVNTTVVRYNLAGFVEFLPSTNQPRVASACSSYKDGGETVGPECRQSSENHLLDSSDGRRNSGHSIDLSRMSPVRPLLG